LLSQNCRNKQLYFNNDKVITVTNYNIYSTYNIGQISMQLRDNIPMLETMNYMIKEGYKNELSTRYYKSLMDVAYYCQQNQ